MNARQLKRRDIVHAMRAPVVTRDISDGARAQVLRQGAAYAFSLGPDLVLDNQPWTVAPGNELRAEDNSAGGAGALPRQVVYRLSVRVGGPRDTQAYFQTTFSK